MKTEKHGTQFSKLSNRSKGTAVLYFHKKSQKKENTKSFCK